MAVAVEHEMRRKKILEKALMVFIEDGYENTTFQKIADQCGITRTILYIYFKNKKEIFKYSTKQILLNVQESINKIRADKSLNSIEKITMVLYEIFRHLEQNDHILSVILDYILHVSKSNVAPEIRLKRRTVKMRHILSSMVIEGIKAGEIKKIKIKTIDDYLYNFIESAIFQVVVLKRTNLDDLRNTVTFAVKLLSV